MVFAFPRAAFTSAEEDCTPLAINNDIVGQVTLRSLRSLYNLRVQSKSQGPVSRPIGPMCTKRSGI